ncbi:MAG: hypothetical protein DRO40_00195 [Thermoprotei archaeon]|nr:MAG: hypothetical protein DRO40_00195 [Thermoprotei archaeon]
MKAAVVYYSKTGRTRQVALYIGKKLTELGVQTSMYEIKLVKEYFRWLLHLNPRLVYDTLSGKLVEIRELVGFNPEDFDVLLLGTPIWIGRVAPAMNSFVRRYKDKISKPIACFTTSGLKRDYALKFKSLLESLGYKVIAYVSISDFNRDRSNIDHFVSKIVEYLKTSR